MILAIPFTIAGFVMIFVDQQGFISPLGVRTCTHMCTNTHAYAHIHHTACTHTHHTHVCTRNTCTHIHMHAHNTQHTFINVNTHCAPHQCHFSSLLGSQSEGHSSHDHWVCDSHATTPQREFPSHFNYPVACSSTHISQ